MTTLIGGGGQGAVKMLHLSSTGTNKNRKLSTTTTTTYRRQRQGEVDLAAVQAMLGIIFPSYDDTPQAFKRYTYCTVPPPLEQFRGHPTPFSNDTNNKSKNSSSNHDTAAYSPECVYRSVSRLVDEREHGSAELLSLLQYHCHRFVDGYFRVAEEALHAQLNNNNNNEENETEEGEGAQRTFDTSFRCPSLPATAISSPFSSSTPAVPHHHHQQQQQQQQLSFATNGTREEEGDEFAEILRQGIPQWEEKMRHLPDSFAYFVRAAAPRRSNNNNNNNNKDHRHPFASSAARGGDGGESTRTAPFDFSKWSEVVRTHASTTSLQSLCWFWRDYMVRLHEVQEVWSAIPSYEVRQFCGENRLFDAGVKWLRAEWRRRWMQETNTPSLAGATSAAHPQTMLSSGLSMLGGTTASAAAAATPVAPPPEPSPSSSSLQLLATLPSGSPAHVLVGIQAQPAVLQAAIFGYLHLLLMSLIQSGAEEVVQFMEMQEELQRIQKESAATTLGGGQQRNGSTNNNNNNNSAEGGGRRRQRDSDKEEEFRDQQMTTVVIGPGMELLSGYPSSSFSSSAPLQHEDASLNDEEEGKQPPGGAGSRQQQHQKYSLPLTLLTRTFTDFMTCLHLYVPLLEPLIRHLFHLFYTKRAEELSSMNEEEGDDDVGGGEVIHFVHCFSDALSSVRLRCLGSDAIGSVPLSSLSSTTTTNAMTASSSAYFYQLETKKKTQQQCAVGNEGSCSLAVTSSDRSGRGNTTTGASGNDSNRRGGGDLHPDSYSSLKATIERSMLLYYKTKSFAARCGGMACRSDAGRGGVNEGDQPTSAPPPMTGGNSTVHTHPVLGCKGFRQLAGEPALASLRLLWSLIRKSCCLEELETVREGWKIYVEEVGMSYVSLLRWFLRGQRGPLPPLAAHVRCAPTAPIRGTTAVPDYSPMQTILALLGLMRRGEEVVQHCFVEEAKAFLLLLHEKMQLLLGTEPAALSEELVAYVDVVLPFYADHSNSSSSSSTPSIAALFANLKRVLSLSTTFFPSACSNGASPTAQLLSMVEAEDEESASAAFAAGKAWAGEALLRAADLCTFFSEKSHFKSLFQRRLAHRLLLYTDSSRTQLSSIAADLAGEHFFVSALQTRCGQGFSSVFSTMLREMENEEELTRVYHQWRESRGTATITLSARLRGHVVGEGEEEEEEKNNHHHHNNNNSHNDDDDGEDDGEGEETYIGRPHVDTRILAVPANEEEAVDDDGWEELFTDEEEDDEEQDVIFSPISSSNTSDRRDERSSRNKRRKRKNSHCGGGDDAEGGGGGGDEHYDGWSSFSHLPDPMPLVTLKLLGQRVWPTFSALSLHWSVPRPGGTSSSAKSASAGGGADFALYGWSCIANNISRFYKEFFPTRRIEWAPQLSTAVLSIVSHNNQGDGGGNTDNEERDTQDTTGGGVEVMGSAVQCAALLMLEECGGRLVVRELCQRLSPTPSEKKKEGEGENDGWMNTTTTNNTSVVPKESSSGDDSGTAQWGPLLPFLSSLCTLALPLVTAKSTSAPSSSPTTAGGATTAAGGGVGGGGMRRVKKYCSAGIPLPLLSFDDVLEVNGEEAFWANLRSAGRARSGHCFTIPQPGGKSTGLSGGGGGGSVLCRAGLLRPTDTHNLFSPTTTACMSSSPTTTGLRNFRDEERAAGEAEGEEEEDDAEVERQRREAAELAKKERLFQLQIGVTRVLKSCAAVTMEELAAALSPTNGTGRGGGGGGELSAVGGSGAVEGDAGRGGGARRGFQMRFAIDMRELKLVVEKLMERSVVRRNVDGSLEYVS